MFFICFCLRWVIFPFHQQVLIYECCQHEFKSRPQVLKTSKKWSWSYTMKFTTTFSTLEARTKLRNFENIIACIVVLSKCVCVCVGVNPSRRRQGQEMNTKRILKWMFIIYWSHFAKTQERCRSGYPTRSSSSSWKTTSFSFLGGIFCHFFKNLQKMNRPTKLTKNEHWQSWQLDNESRWAFFARELAQVEKSTNTNDTCRPPGPSRYIGPWGSKMPGVAWHLWQSQAPQPSWALHCFHCFNCFNW